MKQIIYLILFIPQILVFNSSFSQNETTILDREREYRMMNKVSARTDSIFCRIGDDYKCAQVIQRRCDEYGFILPRRFEINEKGQKIKEIHCDSCFVQYWIFEYKGNNLISAKGYGNDTVVSNTMYEYSTQNRPIAYSSMWHESTQLIITEQVDSGFISYIRTGYERKEESGIIVYFGDTVRHYSAHKPDSVVFEKIEQFSREGFPIRYAEPKANFRIEYIYNSENYLIYRKYYHSLSGGCMYTMQHYLYHENGLLKTKFYYQNSFEKPLTIYRYSYEYRNH